MVDGRGLVDYAGPFGPYPVPADLPVLGGRDAWIGPGIVDAHVHLGFGDVDRCLRLGLVGVRDLGAPLRPARAWRTGHRPPTGERPVVAVAGPILTAPGGYPSRSWGSDGYATFVGAPGSARQLVQRLAADGADVIKVALEPGDAGVAGADPAGVAGDRRPRRTTSACRSWSTRCGPRWSGGRSMPASTSWRTRRPSC